EVASHKLNASFRTGWKAGLAMKHVFMFLLLAAFGVVLSIPAAAQNNEEGYAKEVYTGTFLNMNGRSLSTGFTLTLTSRTPDEEAQRYLAILADAGQDDLLKAIRKNNLGFIAATGHTRRDLLVIREAQVNGKRRIIAAFERWVGVYEARAGNRSLDYPFSIIEIYFDQKGRGTGTFIGLAQVKIVRDKKTEQLRLELESFGSFPAKVMGVMRRK
ncbi:MAG TPA: hypothetical protein VJZ91_18765, partial [Blastocatellia bacterium]|nr:hypothetical protein [Blastocatellia bacterium]